MKRAPVVLTVLILTTCSVVRGQSRYVPHVRATVDKAEQDRAPAENLIAQWTLIGITAVTAAFICWQARETRRAANEAANSVQAMKEQGAVLERQTKATEISAEATKETVKALINTERAWIEGEIVKNKTFPAYCYIAITNHGKTPARLFGYAMSFGFIAEGTKFSVDRLSGQRTENFHVFVGSGGERNLYDFKIDDLFSGKNDEDNGTGYVVVRISYADVVSQGKTPDDVHETSFVYTYLPLVASIERISALSKYT